MLNHTQSRRLNNLLIASFLFVFILLSGKNFSAIAQFQEKMPEFPGGKSAMMRYFDKNIKYPPEAAKRNIQGTVVVHFVVTESGKVKKVKVVESADPLLDKEAVRVTEAMPAWIPGEYGGRRISANYTLPIEFSLNRISRTVHVDKLPKFPGGYEALSIYLKDKLKTIEQSMERNVEGKITLQFVVDTIGTIKNVEVTEGIDSEIDGKIKRMVETMPNWTPGESEGQKVVANYTLPITISFKKIGEKPVVVEKASTDVIYTVVEKKPQFPGGNDALSTFITQNMRYPLDAKQRQEEGQVFVEFVVDKAGKIMNTRVIRGVCVSLDKEAIRLVENMPAWIPGELRGKVVNTKYTIPIEFKLANL